MNTFAESSDHDPSLRRVEFTIMSDAVPQLMKALTPFIMEHDVEIAFTGVPPAGTRPERVSFEQFNPRYVSKFVDDWGEIPVVRKPNLQAFAEDAGADKQKPGRLAGALLNKWAVGKNPQLQRYVVTNATTATTDDIEVYGLRPERAQELYERLSAREIEITHIGRVLIEFLGDFSQALPRSADTDT